MGRRRYDEHSVVSSLDTDLMELQISERRRAPFVRNGEELRSRVFSADHGVVFAVAIGCQTVTGANHQVGEVRRGSTSGISKSQKVLCDLVFRHSPVRELKLESRTLALEE